MNIEQANDISLTIILQKISAKLTKQDGADLWYLSPLRKEKTASFHIHIKKDVWFDHGLGIGGDAVEFVRAYLRSQNEDYTVHDALRWLRNMVPGNKAIPAPSKEDGINEVQTLRLRKIMSLQSPMFIHYLLSRGIPLPCAQKYLKEVEVFNTKTNKAFFAIAFKNDDGGYELRNTCFKGCVRSKDITVIRGSNLDRDHVHIFEGFLDFLSMLMHEKKIQLEGDAIILNSVSLLHKSFAYISDNGYKTVHSWFDNDTAGKIATENLRNYIERFSKAALKPMNKLYKEHKDVNAWHMHKLKLKPLK